MVKYRIPLVLFTAVSGTILILWSCSSQQDAQKQNGKATEPLQQQLHQAVEANRKLREQNAKLKQQLTETTRELVRVKVERDVLKLELGPRKTYPAKKRTPDS